MASETVVGEVVYRVKIDSSGLDASVSRAGKTIKKGMESSASEAGKTAGGRTGTKFLDAVKSALTSAATTKIFDGFLSGAKMATSSVANLVKSSVAGFANYEQLVGGVETLFKESAGIIEEYADNAYKTAGLSANQYMETVTSFSASLLQSLDGDTEAVARTSDMAVTDMADNANKMGSSMESIQNAYQGFAKQNYTMLDNLKLGYGGTKSEMERLLKDAQEVSGIEYNIDNLSDVYNAIHVIQGELGITGTTAKEAEETISGSMASMKTAWSNLIVELGNGSSERLPEMVGNFTESLKTFLGNLMPVISAVLSQLPTLIQELVPQLVQVIIEVAPSLVDGIVTLVNTIAGQLPELIVAVMPALLDGLLQVVLGIAQILPELIIAITEIILQIVDVLTEPNNLDLILNAAITLLMGLIDATPKIIIKLIGAIPKIVQSIADVLTKPDNIARIFEAAITMFFAVVNAVPQILGPLLSAFGGVVGGLWSWITGTFAAFATNFGTIVGGIFRGAINGVLGFIEGFINQPIGLINAFIGVINGAFGALGVNIGFIPNVYLPRLAAGGIVEGNRAGTVIMAGEAGEDEWVVPESKIASLVEQLETRANGGAPNITINVSGVFATSPVEQRRVAEQIYQRLQELDRARFGGVTI